MNTVDRDRRFREAADALVHAIRQTVQTQPDTDPLTLTFLLVHATSPETFRALMANNGSICGDGFAFAVGQRDLEGSPLNDVAADRIACMISIDNWHKALGLPLDRLSELRFERDEEISVWESVVSQQRTTGATMAEAVTAADMLIVAAREAASKLPDGPEMLH
jgi:hypothetical protein